MRHMTLTASKRPKLNWLRGVISSFVVILLASCVTIGREFDLASIDRVQITMTTMAEVRSIFGYPHTEIEVSTWGVKRMHFGDEEAETIWRYIYARGTIGIVKVKGISIEFDKNGRVSDYYYGYYSSTFGVEEPKGQDFDIFLAKEQIIPGETTRTEVKTLLGKGYRVMIINKPGVVERWRYNFTAESKDEKISVGRITIAKDYGKGLDIDYDKNGVVFDIRGESDFPEDIDKFFTKAK